MTISGAGDFIAAHHTRWAQILTEARERAAGAQTLIVEGRLTRMVGLTLEAVGLEMPVGGRCEIIAHHARIEAEVVGFSGDRTFLMPVGDIRGLTPNASVRPLNTNYRIPVGAGLLGRVLDGAGMPLDGKPLPPLEDSIDLTGTPINPLARVPIREPLDVGIRAINGLLTVGRGQRMGLFAGSGVGKSVLLGMMTRFTDADVTVVGLIGERGREVTEFVQSTLGEAGMQRAVVVAAPADAPPLMRLHGAWYATAIAEYFRAQGKQVLLLLDSLTRFAQAQREISLAIGEPPATKGYTPSVFTRLPQLVERAGNGVSGGGSITAFYTVLAEGDDQNDPIADAARAILDGHVVLSRDIAERGRYPAIDVEASISRVMPQVVEAEHLANASQFKQFYAAYSQHRDLITVGAYQAGSDLLVDEAIRIYPRLEAYLHQDMHDAVRYEQSVTDLRTSVESQPASGETDPARATAADNVRGLADYVANRELR
ncbi:flagellar protein export ATPase FliI [Acidihalobacter ferrooxydans]|uniref:flagellar protein export ATPase FliI n=1 Tax=Acidihalobacter ferrooxydans TaxID=1765967 RepID=UPI0009FB379D|nr:flagellar protein export ATPase FliI [Acidihalobacter ferrooxydans]